MDQLNRRRFLTFAAGICATSLARAGMGLDLLPPPDADDGLTFRVLAIHDIRDNLKADPATVADTCAISMATLETIFAWLHGKQFTPVSVSQIVASRSGGPRLPPRAVLLSFDDAYESQYSKAFELLKAYNYPAVVGVVTNWTEASQRGPLRISPKSMLPQGYFMNWDKLSEMAASGLVEIASHTHDMHHGAIANPQGNELPAASAHLYDTTLGRYETDAEYRARVATDLGRSTDLILRNTGVVVRTAVWPYGMYNQALSEAAVRLGMHVHLTLDDGPNTPDLPLTKVRRQLVSYDWDVGTMLGQMREPAAYRGERTPVERVVNVSLDDIYDVDPRKREEKLSRLLDRIKDLAPKSVYLKAAWDPDGSGARAAYFPSRNLPMRADLMNRVAWQLITRADVQVYARMPVLAYALPKDHSAATHVVETMQGAPAANGPMRLSPFDDAARDAIAGIYDDLTRYASFNGIVFDVDATLGEYEDASAAALATYASWGLPGDIERIRASDALKARWAQEKTAHLTAFTNELVERVRAYQGGGNVLSVRALSADAGLAVDPDARFAQSLDAFIGNYDFVALAAHPTHSNPPDISAWLDTLAQQVLSHAGARNKTLFELPTVMPGTGQPVDSRALLSQMKRLRAAGVVHLGYATDDFLQNRPDTAVVRDVMSIESTVRPRAGQSI